MVTSETCIASATVDGKHIEVVRRIWRDGHTDFLVISSSFYSLFYDEAEALRDFNAEIAACDRRERNV